MNRTDPSICPDVPPQSSVWVSAVLPAINTKKRKKNFQEEQEPHTHSCLQITLLTVYNI